MDDADEMYIAQEERDPERLESILRHSSRRQDAPVMLVQLPNSNPGPPNEEFPLNRANQRRATIVNTAGAPQINLEEQVDPFEWYFHRNSPDLRTSLVREGAVDDLTSRRKSRVGDQMEQVVLMLSNQNLNRYPVSFQVKEDEGKDGVETSGKIGSKLEKKGVEPHGDEVEVKETTYYLKGKRMAEEEKEYECDIEEETMPVIDNLIRYLDYGNKTSVMSEQSSYTDQKPSVKDIPVSFQRSSREIAVMVAEPSAQEQKSPFKDKSRNATVSFGQEITVMPAEYSVTDQKSPFKKDRDEIRPRPSSRVRVLIMVDEWDEDDRFDEEDSRKRHARGDGRGGKDKDHRGERRGRRKSDDSIYSDDDTRRENIYDKSPLNDKSKDGGKRGRRPGDQDSDRRKYGSGRRTGDGASEGYDGDGRSYRGGRPEDKEYEDGRSYREGRPGGKDYDKKKYGDGTRSDGPDEDFDGRSRKGKSKGRPGGDNEVTKYRVVSMPKSATTLMSRRRYHLQVTDHEMKEPWFNSCFNISKENNVDLNYEGPVKITPYYVGDKLS